MSVASEAHEYSTLSLLIENTPFNELELKQLIGLFEARGSSKLLVLKSGYAADDHDYTPNGVIVPKDDLTLSILTGMTGNMQHDVRKNMDMARFLRRTLPHAFFRTLGKALFHSEENCYVLNCGPSDVELFKFVEAMAVLMGRRGSSQVIEFLYDSVSNICVSGGATAAELVRLCYILAVASSLLSCYCDDTMGQLGTIQQYDPPQALVASLALLVGKQNANSTKVGDTVIPRPLFREWINNTAPHLASTLPTFLHQSLFMGKPFPKSRLVPFRFPNLVGDQTSVYFSSSEPYSPLHFCFASLSHSLSTTWHQLYCLDHFGSDFATILETILGYNGPMIFIISARGGGVFGAFTSAQWKLSGDFFGDGDCFLFCIDPCVKVYRPTGDRRNYMYCNPSSRTSYNDGKAHGIGFGGTTDAPRLFIPESSLLDNDTFCRAGSYDTTYEQGTILPDGNSSSSMHLPDRFQIDNLEIWGIGDNDTFEKAIQARDFQRSVMNSNVRKAQTIVNKYTFMDDLTAGFINTKLWEHRDHITQRDACD